MGSGSDGEKSIKVKVKAEPSKDKVQVKEEKTKVHHVVQGGHKGGDDWGKGKGKGKGSMQHGKGHKGHGGKGGGKGWKGGATWESWGKDAKDLRENRYDYDYGERDRRSRDRVREKEATITHEIEPSSGFFDTKFSNEGKGYKGHGGKKGHGKKGYGGKGGKGYRGNNEDITGFDINEKPQRVAPPPTFTETEIKIEDEAGQQCTVTLEDGEIVLHVDSGIKSAKKRTVTQVKFFDETNHLQFKCKEADWHMALPDSYGGHMETLQTKLSLMVKKAGDMAKEQQAAAEKQAAAAAAEKAAAAAAAAKPMHSSVHHMNAQPLLQTGTRAPISSSFQSTHPQHPQHPPQHPPQQTMFSAGGMPPAQLGTGMFSNQAMRAPGMAGMSSMSNMPSMSGVGMQSGLGQRQMPTPGLQHQQQQAKQQWAQPAKTGWPSQTPQMQQMTPSQDLMKMMQQQQQQQQQQQPHQAMKPTQPSQASAQAAAAYNQQLYQQRVTQFLPQSTTTPMLMNPITGMNFQGQSQMKDRDASLTEY